MDSDTSSDTDSSDSDEILEEVTFLSKLDKKRSQTYTPIKDGTAQQEKDDEAIGNKLSMLLSSHREEVRRDELHQRMKNELLHSIDQGSQVDASFPSDDSLNGEFAEHIKKLEVTIPELMPNHPTVTIFSPTRFCCLFKENINPFSCGFSRSHFSKIDKVLASFRPDNLIPLLMSHSLPSCFGQVSSPQCVMMWLLSLSSIHSSSMVLDLIRQNMTSIIDNSRVHQGGDNKSERISWCPKPIEIIRILVNMGADPAYLLGNQTLYSAEDVKEHLAVENDENDSVPTKSPGRVKILNCQIVFEILTRCFRTKPEYSKEEISLMVCLIMKVSMDSSFQNLELRHIFQDLLSCLLECCKESDWFSVVPSLCRELITIPHHHRSSVYLVDLMPLSARGNYIQIRLGFLLLCSTLDPERKHEHSTLQLDSILPSRISCLGQESPDTPGGMSRLYTCLHRLINQDTDQLDSAITLLDRAVGDETNRAAQPKNESDFLTNQVRLVIRDIRDSINTLNLSKMKDRMTIMTKKWMMMSTQNTKSVQRSIFSWVTSHANVQEVKLKDSISNVGDEEMDVKQ